jgi:ATP-dependent DNA helicase RecG
VRQAGYDPIQQEQMVLQYAQKHARITRTEAAELCHIGLDQASRLLRRLVDQRKLVLHGEKRGAYYAPTE